MLTLVTLWWLLFFTAIGLCVGSFLNVVIHRLPRNGSLRVPLYSACPYCRHRIRFRDNLPILSFIMLRGRCRDCRAPISTRYPVIEAAMALIVLMLFDAFFIGHVRAGLTPRPVELAPYVWLAEQLALDWPILVAHIILFACLLSMSAIDLEHYWVDIRFTNLATIAGFALHGLWTPTYSTQAPTHAAAWVRPFDTTAVVCLLALAGLAITWIVLICQPHVDPEDFGQSEASDNMANTSDYGDDPSPPGIPRLELGWVSGLMLLGLFICLLVTEAGGVALTHAPRALLPLLLLVGLIVRENRVVRESDRKIEQELEEERYGARRMVLTEFGFLLPAVLLGLVGFWIMSAGGEPAERISEALHAHARVPGVSMMRHWAPLQGLATAASGFVIAGAMGWAIRIVFTLAFGKEAFGTGDIHLMAATGCVAGWPVVVLGFVLTCGLAIVGWLLSRKQSRALPLGPWLAVSFLVVVVFFDSITQWQVVARFSDLVNVLFF